MQCFQLTKLNQTLEYRRKITLNFFKYLKNMMRFAGSLWSKITKNPDVRTGPLAYKSVCSFVCTVHSLASLTRSAVLTQLLTRLLNPPLVGQLMAFFSVVFSILDHSAAEIVVLGGFA